MKFEEIRKNIQELILIGEGWRGIVYRGKYQGLDLAFKVARSKEQEHAIRKEGKILERLLGIHGFPQIVLSGDDFIAYKFIEGKPFRKVELSKDEKLRVYLQVLRMAYMLDRMGINRDEFQNIEKNLVIGEDKTVYLLDFERGSLNAKKPHNLPQFMQLLVREGILERSRAIELGKVYKERMEEVFRELEALLEKLIFHTA